MAAINNARKVKVQQRSGFDKSFRNTLTGHVGTLIPILVDELIPDTKVNLKINLATALPPLVSDTYMNVRLRVEAFVVPHRLCQANFEDFFSDYPVETVDNDYSSFDDFAFTEFKGCMPLIQLNSVDNLDFASSLTGAGSLTDYMGIETRPSDAVGSFGKDIFVPIAPYVAYHLIWQEWYRNPRVQRPAFVPSQTIPTVAGSTFNAVSVPYTRFYFGANNSQPSLTPYGDNVFDTYLLSDSVNILSLRQRNFGLDYFTSALVEPQQGDVAVVKFGENGDPEDGFSIASLRAMNSIQQFRERNGLTSPRYQQQLYARYGVAPSDGVIQRPVLIGASTYDVYSHGVTQSANIASDPSVSVSANPFSEFLGARAGNAFAGGSDFIISGFHAKEPMYLFVIASLVPEVSYSQNLNMIFRRYKGVGSITDMGNAILQNVGPQPITTDMISVRGNDIAVFAYADRYSDFMYRNNEIHGKFKFGQDLASFVLQRYFSTSVPEFGSEFLTIPTDYLDDVLSVKSEVLGFGYWMDVMFEYRVSMPLQEYAIPSLQDPGYEHGKTIVLRKNGQLL